MLHAVDRKLRLTQFVTLSPNPPTCRTCTAYVLRPCYVGMKTVKFVTEMGCEKNMPAVQWMGPCPFYQREPGAD